jgi:hypothetical protein
MSWDRYRKAFEELAREEEGAEPDQRLCAWRDYSNPPAILDEKGKPRQRPLCVIRAPENGLWILDAGVNKTLQERFRTHGARAGRVLGARRGTDAEGVWLHRLYSYVSENHGEFIAPKIGGRTSAFRHMDRILYVCEASAIYCAWLERQALEQSKPGASDTREEILRPILETKGFSVLDWATAADVDFHTANDYLKGKTNPYKSTRKKLADALGVPVEELPA